jgi:hypothetical protein
MEGYAMHPIAQASMYLEHWHVHSTKTNGGGTK